MAKGHRKKRHKVKPTPPAKPVPRLGSNLDHVTFYSSQRVFGNIIRQSQPWRSQTATGSEWDTKEPVPVTSDGWPILREGQAAGTLIFRDIGGKYPGGSYNVKWKGSGKVLFAGDAKDAGAGRIEVTPSSQGIILKLIGEVTDLVLYEAKLGTSPPLFHPDFIAELSSPKYFVLRFMDWQRTNEQVPTKKPTPMAFASQDRPGGVAPEIIAMLCNALGADPWVCTPHAATDDEVAEMATRLHNTLSAERLCYVEYSNETWNSLFPQTQYCIDRGMELKLDPDKFRAGHRYSSRRSLEVFAIFGRVFGNHRLVRVMAGQATSPSVLETRMSGTPQGSVDAIAIAPYFYAREAEGDSEVTVDRILNYAKANIDRAMAFVSQHKEMADRYGVNLIAYEGGQHLWSQKSPSLAEVFIEANRHPGMGVLYADYLNKWERATGGSLFMHMNNCRWPMKNGAWGARDYTGQPVEQCPKLQALQAYGEQCHA